MGGSLHCLGEGILVCSQHGGLFGAVRRRAAASPKDRERERKDRAYKLKPQYLEIANLKPLSNRPPEIPGYSSEC